MYHQTVGETGVQKVALKSPGNPADAQTSRFSPAGMERAAENFHRLSAEAASFKGKRRVWRRTGEIMRKLFGAALLFGIGVAAAPPTAVGAQPIACGTIYAVERGDTLFTIAARAYGDGREYEIIFKANRDLLPDLSSVEIGDQILIPCLDGTGPRTRGDAMAQGLLDQPGDQELTAVQTTEEPTQTAAELLQTAKQLVQRIALPARSFTGSVPMIEEPYQTVADPIQTTAEPVRTAEEPVQTFKEPPQIAANPMPAAIEPVKVTADTMAVPPLAESQIKFLTGSGFAPFADESLHVGGMITDLVTRAVNTAAPEQEFRVTFISDWPAHLDVLLRDGAFDVSFPWHKPDCSKPEKLDEELRIRCDEFEFSNPFYEVSVGYYTRAGDPLVKADSHAGLFGKKLCRPKGPFMFDPDQSNLTASNVAVETSATAIECFFRLLRGQVDVVSLVRSKADAELRRLGIIDEVAEIEGLESSQTLHALVPKSNPNGRAYLDIINQGMASLMASGEWFEVVAYHQSPQLALMD